MEIYSCLYFAWLHFCIFLIGFSLRAAMASSTVAPMTQILYRPPHEDDFFRAPAKEKEERLYSFALYGSLLAFFSSSFLCEPECAKCQLVPDLYGWQGAVAFPVFMTHGFFIRLLFELIQLRKARRNVSRFLNDGAAEGCIRAIYERTSPRLYEPFKWVLRDVTQDEHGLRQIAKRAVRGKCDTPVYIAMNIPPEQVLQKLAQYNLVTRNGYKRLPPAKTSLFPKGGSMVHFYYHAEYVRIWG